MKRYGLSGMYLMDAVLKENENGPLVLHADAMYEISQLRSHIAHLERRLRRLKNDDGGLRDCTP